MPTLKNNYLFLDIDGVVCHYSYGLKPAVEFDGKLYHPFDPACIQRINKIVEVTNTKVVLSSAWRISPGLERTNAYLRFNGANFDLIGKTRNCGNLTESGLYLSVPRGVQIATWLKENDPGHGFVLIIDDDRDMAHLMDKLLHIENGWNTGITDKHVDLAIEKYKNYKRSKE